MLNSVKISVLVEDTAADHGLKPEHGLALWLETPRHRVLWDTGQGAALLPNARRLEIDPTQADMVALSHGHYDHTGGIRSLAGAGWQGPVCLHPAAIEPKFACTEGAAARRIGFPDAHGKPPRELLVQPVWTTGPVEIVEGLHVTGEIPRQTDFEDTGGPFYLDAACTEPDTMIDDQALFFVVPEGVVLVLGCAHAGVVNTMRRVAELTGCQTLHCVVGGLHLSNASERRIRHTLDAFRQLDVEQIIVGHCTGNRAVRRFRDAFPSRCKACAAGAHFSFGTAGDGSVTESDGVGW